MSVTFLKVKINTFLAECAAIRREESKHPLRLKDAQLQDVAYPDNRPTAVERFWLRYELRDHREGLGPEARATYLAYAFLRGRSYESTEPRAKWLKNPSAKAFIAGKVSFNSVVPGAPKWHRVEDMVKKYGHIDGDIRKMLMKWVEGEQVIKLAA